MALSCLCWSGLFGAAVGAYALSLCLGVFDMVTLVRNIPSFDLYPWGWITFTFQILWLVLMVASPFIARRASIRAMAEGLKDRYDVGDEFVYAWWSAVFLIGTLVLLVATFTFS
ncbi:MAG: hypothetical protein WA580_04175 [Acidimicrobiales bacterium]